MKTFITCLTLLAICSPLLGIRELSPIEASSHAKNKPKILYAVRTTTDQQERSSRGVLDDISEGYDEGGAAAAAQRRPAPAYRPKTREKTRIISNSKAKLGPSPGYYEDQLPIREKTFRPSQQDNTYDRKDSKSNDCLQLQLLTALHENKVLLQQRTQAPVPIHPSYNFQQFQPQRFPGHPPALRAPVVRANNPYYPQQFRFPVVNNLCPRNLNNKLPAAAAPKKKGAFDWFKKTAGKHRIFARSVPEAPEPKEEQTKKSESQWRPIVPVLNSTAPTSRAIRSPLILPNNGPLPPDNYYYQALNYQNNYPVGPIPYQPINEPSKWRYGPSAPGNRNPPVSYTVPIIPPQPALPRARVPGYAVLDSDFVSVGDFDETSAIVNRLQVDFPPLPNPSISSPPPATSGSEEEADYEEELKEDEAAITGGFGEVYEPPPKFQEEPKSEGEARFPNGHQQNTFQQHSSVEEEGAQREFTPEENRSRVPEGQHQDHRFQGGDNNRFETRTSPRLQQIISQVPSGQEGQSANPRLQDNILGEEKQQRPSSSSSFPSGKEQGPFRSDPAISEDHFKQEHGPQHGEYNYEFSTATGIHSKEKGFLKRTKRPKADLSTFPTNPADENDPTSSTSDETLSNVKQGSVTWTSPDGYTFHLTYEADENGYRPLLTQTSMQGNG